MNPFITILRRYTKYRCSGGYQKKYCIRAATIKYVTQDLEFGERDSSVSSSVLCVCSVDCTGCTGNVSYYPQVPALRTFKILPTGAGPRRVRGL